MVILKGPWKMCNVAEEPKDVTIGFFIHRLTESNGSA